LITSTSVVHHVGVTLYVGSQEAARRLGVRRETLYAYVSRGEIGRRTAIDGRTSLYSVDDIDRLTARSRGRQPASARPSIDVQVTSAITQLDELFLHYRGYDVAELCVSATFEQVAGLLWTGSIPGEPPMWPDPDPDDVAACQAAVAALGPSATALQRLLVLPPVLDARHVGDDAPAAARRLITMVPALARVEGGGPVADRLGRAWHQLPNAALVHAIGRALVLLADHELATSTLAVRIAASVRATPYAAIAAGLATVSGALHGSAAAAATHMLAVARDRGAAVAIRQIVDAGQRLPGFGHSVYRTGDPRLAPLLDAVRLLPDASRLLDIVASVLAEPSLRISPRPNIDFRLAALAFVGGLEADVPIFAVARVAGWAAHIGEELEERPLRFRGLAQPVGVTRPARDRTGRPL